MMSYIRRIARDLAEELDDRELAELVATLGLTPGGGALQAAYSELSEIAERRGAPNVIVAVCVDAEEVSATYSVRVRELGDTAYRRWQWAEAGEITYFDNEKQLQEESLG